jgi:SP family sugar:H+ symporter-like MFS transporter
MAIGYIWAIFLCIGMFMMPESPRYDIRNGFHERAFKTMTSFYGVSVNHRAVAVETAEINANIRASQGVHAWYEVFTGPRMAYRVALAMGLQMLQQLTGANYFFYYGTTIFKGVGIENSYVTSMILGGVNVGTTFLGLYFVEHFGRRKCLIGGAIWMFICFIIFATIGHFRFDRAPVGSSDAKTYGTVLIVFACLFIAGFASTWGPMIWAVNSEMFPYRYRANAMAMATASNWFWNFLLAFFSPFITGDIGYLYGYVFAGCNIAAAAVIYFFLIESAGRTIEEIDTMYLIHVPPIQSSKWTSEMIEKELVSSDNMYLSKTGREKSDSDAGKTQQVEGALKHEDALPANPTPSDTPRL